MNIPQLTVSRFKGPLLMRVQVPDSNIVNDNIINQCVPINTDLHVELTRWSVGDGLFLFRYVILFQYL